MSQEEFENIIDYSGIKTWLEERKTSELTVGDLYETAYLLAQVQISVQKFLTGITEAIVANYRSESVVKKMPAMTDKQIAALMNLVDAALTFESDDFVEG